MIIADVSNFSSFDDQQVHTFFTRFLGDLMKVLEPYRDEIVQYEGWGDAILIVFNSASAVVNAALDFAPLDWSDGVVLSAFLLSCVGIKFVLKLNVKTP